MKNLIFLFFIIIQTGCIYKEKCFKEYNFGINLYLTPLDTFAIGDTLWLTCQIDSLLKDNLSDTEIDVSKFEFKLLNTIAKVDSLTYSDAELDFDYINKKGSTNIGYSGSFPFINATLDENNNLEFGIICKKVGIFQFNTNYIPLDYTDVDITKKGCNESAILDIKMNDNIKNNFHLVQSYYQNKNYNYNLESFQHDGGYAFIVK